MKQFLGRIAVAGLAVGFLCTVADQTYATDPNPVRPYRARTEDTRISVGVCDPGVPSIPGSSENWVGEGNATHGGLTSQDSCIGITGVYSLSPYVLRFAGQGSGTAANGDVVYFDIEDGLTNIDAGCLATFTIQFVGGTGRFEQASGTAECMSTRTTPCGPSEMTVCAGTISY